MPDGSIANSRDLAQVIAVTASVPFSTDEEAFVQDELSEMYRQGLSLSIFPMRRRSVEPNEPARKSGLADVVVGERLVSRAVVAGALRTVGRQPRRSLSAIASALRASHGRRNFLVNASSGLKALWLAGQVDRLDARHLHAYWLSHTSTTAMIAAKIAGITWSATGYRWDIDAENALDLKLSTASFIRCADELGERQLRQAALRIPDACPIYLVRTGVPIPPTAAWSSTPVGTTVVCCAAAFVEKKGHAVLLSAFKEVRRRRPAMELHLFGDGPLRDAITAQVRDLGLVDVVILHGVVPLEDLRSFLRTRRPMYVQPSIQASDGQQEGIPVTLIEAMANGAPVVSTRSGSIASLIPDNCGLLVPPNDAAALAEALVATAEDPVAAHHRCLDAVARLTGDFDLVHTAARMQQLVRAAASPPSAEQLSGMDEETRLSILDRITSVYRAYGTSGHARRWQSQTPGQRLARAELTDWLVKALAPARAGTILDLGCGEGWLATALDAAGIRPSRYVGVDLLTDRIELARDSAAWAEFVVSSADRVPLPDSSVDAVAAVTLFSSLTDDRFRAVVAAEIARLVRPGGIVVIYDIRYRSPSNPDVVPIGTAEIRRLFPGWRVKASTAMTLLPPIMRSPLGGGPLRYRALAKVPLLRSHLGAILIRP